MSIWKHLRFSGGRLEETDSQGETESVRKITRTLDGLDPGKARILAASAFILSRGARADLEISPEETRAIERLVGDWGDLPREQARLVARTAKSLNARFGGTENYLVTKEFGQIASRQQKLSLIDGLFSVSASDGPISTVTENEIRQIASELNLEHSDFIAVRSRYRDHLAVLKNLPSTRT